MEHSEEWKAVEEIIQAEARLIEANREWGALMLRQEPFSDSYEKTGFHNQLSDLENEIYELEKFLGDRGHES